MAAGQLVVTINAAPNLVVDSNVLSPSTYAPALATVSGIFCNYGDAPLTDVIGYIGTYATRTAGSYPQRTPGDPAFDAQHPSLTVANGGAGPYSLTHNGGRAGSADAVRWMGVLDVGECVPQFWHFTYPRVSNNGTQPVFGSNNSNTDDLWLRFDVWGTSTEGPTDNATHKVTMRSEISASANKISPNGSLWTTNPVQATPGNPVTTTGINYELGVINQGFDNDGDGEPDYNAWLQPAGDPTFDPTCLRLIRTDATLQVSRSGGNPDMLIEKENELYYTDLPDDNTGVIGVVYYQMAALNGPCGLSLTPYQEAASGSDNEKFAGDYGAPIGDIYTVESDVSMEKTVDKARANAGETLTYTVSFQNDGAAAVGTPDYGVPLVITDSVPDDTTYVLGSATYALGYAPNSGVSILYSTDGRNTWSAIEPASGSLVTDISWWLRDQLPSGITGTGTVSFQVVIDSPYNGDPVVVNTGEASFGGAYPFATDDAGTLINGTNTIGNYVFNDNGAGGGTALDGLPNGTEPGIASISVTLYWDRNGDGVLDDEDVDLLTESSDGSGAYSFTSLPNGDFLAVVDRFDAQLPQGYSPTGAYEIAVTGLGSPAPPESVLTADFGFGPTLAITKSLPSPNPALEGLPVTYTIDLSNLRPTTRGGCTVEVWSSTLLTSHAAWDFEANIFGVSELDGSYGMCDNAAPGKTLTGGGYTFAQPLGNIATVEIISRVYATGYVDERIDFYVPYSGTLGAVAGTIGGGTLSGCTSAATACDVSVDVTAARAWTWADFTTPPATEVGIGIEWTKSSGGPSSSDLYVDAIGYRITTDEQCGDGTDLVTVPLTDTFDADLLTFVSAVPPVTSSTTGGGSPYANTGTLTWSNVGPILAQESATVTVNFIANEPPGNLPVALINDAASIGAVVEDGTLANDATAQSTGTLNPTAVLAGNVYNDNAAGGGTASNGVQDGTEPGVGGITVRLYLDTNGDGTGDTLLATTATDGTGAYSFDNLPVNTGVQQYVVIVDGTSIPGTETQTGDPDQPGVACTVCDYQTARQLLTATDVTNLYFGFNIPTAIMGRVWNDVDGDGSQDAAESGVSGVTVRLYADADSNCANGYGAEVGAASPQTTNASGYYGFGNLAAPANYCVVVSTGTLPSSSTWAQTGDPDALDNMTTSAVVAAPSTIYQPYDFGYQATGTASLSDTVYRDWDGDGSQDSGEEGIAGVTVSLYWDVDGDGVVDPGLDVLRATDVTDASGLYGFANLPADDWIVVLDQTTMPAGHISSNEPDCLYSFTDISGTGTNLGLADDGESNQTLPFSFSLFGTASTAIRVGDNGGVLFNTALGDLPFTNAALPSGTLPSAAILAFWDDLGTLAGGGVFVQTLGTAPNRVYIVQWNRSHFSLVGAASLQVKLFEGTNRIEFQYADVDFGNAAYNNGISATVGLQQNGTTAVQYSYNSAVITNSSAVCFLASGSTHTVTSSSQPSADFLAAVTTRFGSSSAIDFGLEPRGTAQVGDFVYRDTSANGMVDPGELGLANVLVTLYEDADGNGVYNAGTDAVVDTTVTDADGMYLFDLLIAGNYLVDVDQTDTDIPVDGFGNRMVETTGVDPRAVNLTAGETDLTVDFGFAPGGSLGDTIYADYDGNGDQSIAEPGLNGVTVSLYRDVDEDGFYSVGDTLVSTAVTANDAVYGDGYYVFRSLSVDDYVVVVSSGVPAGYTQTADPDLSVDEQFGVRVPAARPVLYADFGYQPPATIGDRVWIDTDGDGVVDNNEEGIAGVVVELVSAGCTAGVNCPTATTDVDGRYAFPNVANATYTLRILSGLPGTVFATWDADGGTLGTVAVTVSGGNVTVPAVGNLGLDFGYQYTPYVDLYIDKDTTTPTSTAGGTAQYVIRVQNRGTLVANATEIYDTLPAGFTFAANDSIATDAGTTRPIVANPTAGASALTWGRWNIAARGYVAITFTVNIGAGVTAGTYDNTARSRYDNTGDGTPDAGTEIDDSGTAAADAGTIPGQDEEDDEDVTIAARPVLALTKAANPVNGTTVTPGQTITYTLTVTNSGAATASRIRVSDAVPTGTTYTAGSATVTAPADTNGLFADNFENGIPGGSSGTNAWAGNWTQAGTGGAPETIVDGDVSQRFGVNDSIYRAANLSGFATGFQSGTVTYDRRRVGMNNGKSIVAEVSSNGGTSWATMETITGNGGTDASYTPTSYALTSAYMTANFRLRFRAVDTGTDYLYVDNVAVTVSARNPFTGPAHDPAGLIVATDNYSLRTGETMTVSFAVTVNNPAPIGVVSVDNTAYAWSDETPDPRTASTSHPLNSGNTASIGDFVFDDRGTVGAQDGADIGLENVRVELYTRVGGACGDGDDTTLLAVDLTNAAGAYSFGALPAGSYCVTVRSSTVPAGYQLSYGTANQSVTLVAAQVVTTVDFGYNYSPAPLAITLSEFYAYHEAGQLVIEWQTATEAGNAGFYLYGANGSHWVPLRRELHPSKVLDAVAPTNYRATFRNGAKFTQFAIADVDRGGRMHFHGPFPLGERPDAARRETLERVDWASIGIATRQALGQRSARLAPRAGEDLFTRGFGLKVAEDGMVKVRYEDLPGIETADRIDVSELALHDGTALVPIRVGGRGTFGPGMYIEFRGQKRETLYGSERVYILGRKTGAPRMASSSAMPGSADPVTATHVETVRVEEENGYSFAAPNGDPWYMKTLLAMSSPASTTVPVTVDRLDPSANTATVRVDLWGSSFFPANPDHHVELYLNGTLVGDYSFDDVVAYTAVADVDASLLVDGVNQVTIRVPRDIPVDWDFVILDAVSISYPRALEAKYDALTFVAAGPRIEVGGFTSPTVSAFRLSGLVPTHLAGVQTRAELDGTYTAILAGNSKPESYAVVADHAKVLPVVDYARDRAGLDLSSPFDLAIIAHGAFVDALGPYVADREAAGISTRVFDVQSIYDGVGFGVTDAEAIRSFIRVAAMRAGVKYVLLVGGDTYDYHNYLGLGSVSFVPTLYAATSDLIRFAPVDSRYGDIDDDGMPDIAVGRWPVRTAAELDRVMTKSLQYGLAPYLETALIASDGLDTFSATDFAAVGQQLYAALGSQWAASQVDIDRDGLLPTRTAIIDAINEGIGLVTYVGHSSPTRWSFKTLFNTSHALALSNDGRPTAIVQWGCWNTYFVEPTYETLGNRFLLPGYQGAAIVMGAATLTDVQADRRLGIELGKQLAIPGKRVGDALLDAKRAMPGTPAQYADVILGYTLLGDPTAIVVR